MEMKKVDAVATVIPMRFTKGETEQERFNDWMKWSFIGLTIVIIVFLVFLQREAANHAAQEMKTKSSKHHHSDDSEETSAEQSGSEESEGGGEGEDEQTEDDGEFAAVDPTATIHGYSMEYLFNNVYKPNGMFIDLETSPILTVKYSERPKCKSYFSDFVTMYEDIDHDEEMLKQLPNAKEFQMNSIALRMNDDFVDGRKFVNGSYKEVDFTEQFSDAAKFNVWALRIFSDASDAQVGLLHALEANSIEGERGFVYGSDYKTPWVEMIAIKFKPAHLTVAEFQKVKSTIPEITYTNPLEIAKKYKDHMGKYDFAISFAQLAPLGMGREGEKMDPMADVKEIVKIGCVLKKGGILFLAEKIGKDALSFNRGRVYGRVRLPMMMAGFELVETFLNSQSEPIILSSDWMDTEWEDKSFYPVFVLRKK